MKKILALMLAAVMALSLFACGSTTTETTAGSDAASGETTGTEDRLARIKEAGVLTVCTEPYWAPSEFIDPSKTGDDQYVGVDIELANAIADKIGVELDIVPLEFSAVLSGIVEGKYDLAISALGWTQERSETMNLSKGYFTTDENAEYGFAVATENYDEYKELDCDSIKELTIGTQSGSLQEGLYNSYIGSCKEMKLYSSMTDVYLALVEGKIDVAIIAKSSAELWSEANGDKIKTTDYIFPFDEATAGTRVAAELGEDSDSLIELVNEVIDELTEEGKLKEWYNEYKEYAKTLGIE